MVAGLAKAPGEIPHAGGDQVLPPGLELLCLPDQLGEALSAGGRAVHRPGPNGDLEAGVERRLIAGAASARIPWAASPARKPGSASSWLTGTATSRS